MSINLRYVQEDPKKAQEDLLKTRTELMHLFHHNLHLPLLAEQRLDDGRPPLLVEQGLGEAQLQLFERQKLEKISKKCCVCKSFLWKIKILSNIIII
jgi:hypothetical protein